jgi:hypothetical protein
MWTLSASEWSRDGRVILKWILGKKVLGVYIGSYG